MNAIPLPARVYTRNLCSFSDAFPTPAQHFTRVLFFFSAHRNNRCIHRLFAVGCVAQESKKQGTKSIPTAFITMVRSNGFSVCGISHESVTKFLNVPKKDWRRMMRRFIFWFAVLAIAIPALPLLAAHAQSKEAAATAPAASAATPANPNEFKIERQKTNGSVTVEGKVINYDAYAGTLVVHPTGWDDVPQDVPKDDKNPPVEASMFYVAYMKSGADPSSRPVTFIYNGGPGSSTVWLHMGAFGPRRVVTADDTHTPAAPYSLVNNDFSLLDASDLVFVDAPGTGFSRVAGKDKEKAFYGVDQDGHAFAEFITQFLAKYGRWNSPKYLFGESYGTTRSAVLIAMLEGDYDVDFNGVMLLSQILGFDNSVDGPEFNPGIDLPYELGLPTYAATAWYHHKLPNQPSDLESFLKDVEHFSHERIRPGARSRHLFAGGPAPSDRREAARLHRSARRVHPKGQPAHRRRRI